MMAFPVKVTNEAERDVFAALDYIEYVLFNKKAANDLALLVENTVLSLSTFPERPPLCRDVVLQAYGIRYVPVKRYILLFNIDEAKKQVNVLAFVYGKRQWQSLIEARIEEERYSLSVDNSFVSDGSKDEYNK